MTRDEIIAINPGFTLVFVQRTAPFGEALINQLLTALKEAGLPEG